MKENLVKYKSSHGSSGSGSGLVSVSSVVEMSSCVVGFWVVEEIIVVESLIVGESVVVSTINFKKPIAPTKMTITNPNFMMSVKEQQQHVSLL